MKSASPPCAIGQIERTPDSQPVRWHRLLAETALLTTVVFLLVITVFVASCSQEPPEAGGGEHKVRGILLLASEHRTLLKERNPDTAKVGDVIPFRVVASWAIPYVGDVTEKAKLTADPPDRAKVDAAGVFTALAPGKVVVRAEVKVAHRMAGDEVLDFEKASQDDAVSTLTDSVEITVTKE